MVEERGFCDLFIEKVPHVHRVNFHILHLQYFFSCQNLLIFTTSLAQNHLHHHLSLFHDLLHQIDILIYLLFLITFHPVQTLILRQILFLIP